MSNAMAEEPKAPSQAGEQEAQQDSEEAPAKHKKAKAEIGEDGEPLRKKLKAKEKKIKKENESKSQEEKPHAGALHLGACRRRVPASKTWKSSNVLPHRLFA